MKTNPTPTPTSLAAQPVPPARPEAHSRPVDGRPAPGTPPPASPRRRPRLVPGLAAALSLGLILVESAQAGLPEPDNILFGTIARDGVQVTAADHDVTAAGAPIATYTMGSNSRLGDFYSVRVKLESVPPVLAADATQTNDRLYVVVKDYSGDLYATNLLVGTRGTTRQLNLGGTVSNDGDGDGLPDAWELAMFGHLNNNSGSLGANGRTALSNYLTGSDPNNPDDVFRLTLTPNGPDRVISFFARQASGPGYDGLSRSYALEYNTNLADALWFPVPNGTNFIGQNAT